MKESDLYLPLKHFLEAQGYAVKGEVLNCDVLAIKDNEEPVIIELKLSFNLSVLLQVVERLSLTSTVYIGVPKQTTVLKKKRKHVIKLLKMLGLGLITIDHTDNTKPANVTVVLEPSEYKPRIAKPKQKRLLAEFNKREGDPNLGGTAMKSSIMTAYRQQAIRIGQYLHIHGASKASVIAKAINEPKTRDIVYNNHYGWFVNVSRGVYDLSPQGLQEMKNNHA